MQVLTKWTPCHIVKGELKIHCTYICLSMCFCLLYFFYLLFFLLHIFNLILVFFFMMCMGLLHNKNSFLSYCLSYLQQLYHKVNIMNVFTFRFTFVSILLNLCLYFDISELKIFMSNIQVYISLYICVRNVYI